MEMLASIVGENEPKVKFEPYAMNEPSKMLKLVQYDSKEGEDQLVQHDAKLLKLRGEPVGRSSRRIQTSPAACLHQLSTPSFRWNLDIIMLLNL